MFKVGETIKTNTGEEVRVLQLLSARKEVSTYIVCIDQDIFVIQPIVPQVGELSFLIDDDPFWGKCDENPWINLFSDDKDIRQ